MFDFSNSKKMPYLNFPCLYKSEHQEEDAVYVYMYTQTHTERNFIQS